MLGQGREGCVCNLKHSCEDQLCALSQRQAGGVVLSETQASSLIPSLLGRTDIYCLAFLKQYFECLCSKSWRGERSL